ncbi:hypothetical protein LXM94_23395 [Rhizobium sp. TRM95111]|uniref:hypothetical protein n=1 Tax=Rhizobium alarense TaxID=2846851 RepID=UPI001F1E68EC|nr:hypothetical protein [Rhizobium alarense]MCF3642915.1 hypothetical protein [Rhizobium alarense]
MWRLLVPLKYLRIKHPEKLKFDFVFPLVFACIFLAPVLSPDFRAAAADGIQLLERSSDLLSILTGFFVAALAAVATFGGDEMDKEMPGTQPVTLTDPFRPHDPERLTRRRFLCFLFGYLAFVSLAVYLVGFAFAALQTYVIAKYVPTYTVASFIIFWGLYGFALGNLLANTLLGLFYLTDRIHRPNRVVSIPPPKNSPAPDKKEAA